MTTNKLSLYDHILKAESAIENIIHKTPLIKSIYLSDPKTNCQVYLKCEHFQHTGSFKLRGATYKLSSLSKEQLEKGVYTASTGNHGMALSYAAQKLGVKVTVFAPKSIAESKA